jgi:hypothetical protein
MTARPKAGGKRGEPGSRCQIRVPKVFFQTAGATDTSPPERGYQGVGNRGAAAEVTFQERRH